MSKLKVPHSVTPRPPGKGPGFQHFMAMAQDAAQHSTDRSTQVGCVIVGAKDEVLSIGFNSFTSGADTTREERHQRPAKYKWTEHAERNAIYAAARRGTALDGATMYLPWFPCVDCARAIVQSGLACLVAYEPDLRDPRWGEDFAIARQVLEEGGVLLEFASDQPDKD